MYHLQGRMPTPDPSRILTRLCYHFRKKISVDYDDRHGLARFPWGDCELRAEDSMLDFICSAATAEELARVRHVIDEHVALFSRKAPLAVRWEATRAD